jgi:hypothetical protein
MADGRVQGREIAADFKQGKVKLQNSDFSSPLIVPSSFS